MNGFILRSSFVTKVCLTCLLLTAPSAQAYSQLPPGASYSGQTGTGDVPGMPTSNPRAISMYNLGLSAYKQGSPESAIIFFKRACDIDPNLAEAQYNLAVIYQAQKRYKDAIPRFEEVLRLKPSDPDAHFQLGMILQDTGRIGEARQHLSSIAPNNVHFPDAQRRMAVMSNQLSGGNPVQSQVIGQQTYTQGYSPAQLPPVYAQPGASTNSGVMPTQDQQASDPSAPSAQAGVTPASSGGLMQPAVPWAQPPLSERPQALPASQPPASLDLQQANVPGIGQAVGPTQIAAALPATAPNPVPVLANSSLRVIATGFSAPSGLAFDHLGNLYVANYMTNTIDRIAPDGTRSPFSVGVNLRGPIGLTVDDNNNIYVANYNGGTVARISPAGVSTIIATGFHKPYYLTLDRDGNLYVSQQEDNSIVRITIPRPAAVKTQ